MGPCSQVCILLDPLQGVISEKSCCMRLWKCLNVGTVPMFKKLDVGTVPTLKKLNVGTVPMFKKLNVGTLKK